jgi:hypothetical protein
MWGIETGAKTCRECDRDISMGLSERTVYAGIGRIENQVNLDRRSRRLTLMIGPPSDQGSDELVVNSLLSAPGAKVICGGTTANIVAKHLHKEVEVLLHTASKTVPAMGRLAGIDLVTEGILTLSAVLDMLRNKNQPKSIKYAKDAATHLFLQIMNADEIHILLGKAINQAQQNQQIPSLIGSKFYLIDELEYIVRDLGKSIRIDRF